MNNGFTFKNTDLIIPDEASLSCGKSLDVSSRRCRDTSNTPQDIIRRRFSKACDYSLTYTLNHYNCADFISALYALEDAVGLTGSFVYGGRLRGDVIIQSASYAIEVDGWGSITAVGVSLSMKESRQPSSESKITMPIRTL